MVAASSFTEKLEPSREDERVFLFGKTWRDYVRFLSIKGDEPHPRVYYLDGTIELMSPSETHENIKKTIARVFEAWAEGVGIDVEGYGSWTLRSERARRGAEPDECYFRAPRTRRKKPDLAIEVMWTSGGLDKLEIYAGIGVRELWLWHRDGRLDPWVLRRGRYVRTHKSGVFPEIDLVWLAGFVRRPSQSEAVRALRAALRARSR